MRTDPAGPEGPQAVAGGGALPGRQFSDGVSQSGREPNRLFLSQGGRQFLDASGVSGLDARADGRAFAWLDFDRDGWQDVAVVNANAPLLQIFRNELRDAGGATAGRVVAISFRGANRRSAPTSGASSASNRDGIGARVEVDLGDLRLVREHRAGEGLAAQNGSRMLIGIGDRDAARTVTIRWPSGVTRRYRDLRAGEELVAFEDPGQSPDGTPGLRRAYLRPTRPPDLPSADPPVRLLADLPETAPLRVLTTLATWCEACREELPQLRSLRDHFDEDEVALLGVPVDDDETPDQIARWARQHRPPYRVLQDLGAEHSAPVRRAVEQALGRDALPASVITDAKGRVLRTLFGAPTVSDLRALLRN